MNKYIKIKFGVLFFFIVLFFSLNDIIDLLITKYYNLNNIEEIKSDNLSYYKKDNVYYWIEELDIYGNIAKYLNFRGWSFVETEEDSSNRNVELILFNQEKQYIISTTLHERETFRAFPDKKINGKKHGFYGKVSLINLNNGIYDLYIRDVENSKNYGLVNTKRFINIYGKNICISEINKLNSCINILNTITSGDVMYNIEHIYTSETTLNISGWAYLKSMQGNARVIIGVKDSITNREEFYTAAYKERPDVVKYFNNNQNLLYSGFDINIPFNKKYEISSIVVAYKGKYYKTELDKIESIKYQKQVNFNQIETNELINFYIEKNKEENNALEIEGWAYINNINKTGKIYVGVKDKTGKEIYYTAEQIERPDVVKHFNNNADLLNSGFKANIKLDNAGDYTLSSIIIEYNGKYYRKAVK